MKLWDICKDKLREHKDSFFQDAEESYSYEEILRCVEENKEVLKGAPEKSKCIIYCDTGLNTGKALLTCLCANLVPIVLSKHYGESHAKKIIDLVRPDLCIVDKEYEEVPWDADLCCFNIKNNALTGAVNYEVEEEYLRDIAIILCTSGTTGTPKGAMISDKSLICNIMDIDEYFAINSKDKILIARPLYHCGVLTGEFFISIFKGVNITFYDDKYNPLALLNAIKSYGITVLGGTPTLFNHLCLFARRSKSLLNLNAAVISGECLTMNIAKKIRSCLLNTDIYSVYGLTEASPRVSCLDPNLFEQYGESVGKPLSSVEVRIVDDSGEDISTGKDGNLLVRGDNVMNGYYKNTKLTSDTIKDGWLLTKDIASIDEKGLIYIKSRKDDMIIKAGMNIYPREIENELIKHEAIKEVNCYGSKDEAGEKISIDVVLSQPFEEYSSKEIYEICSEQLPAYQLPTTINIVTELKRNASGKIIKRK